MTRILITGVRGKTGAPLASLLTNESGVEVLGGSSDPASVTSPGLTPVAFSWDHRSTWSAVRDVDAVYLVRPDREDAPELVAELLDQVPARARIVLLSGAEAGFVAPHAWAVEVERSVTERGQAWTILRPSWFMQVFLDDRFYRSDLADDGQLRFASGGAAVAWIDARDIAAVAQRALLDDDHDGRVHELSGPEALTLTRTSEVLSGVLGRRVVHEEITIDEAVADLPGGFERDQSLWVFERLARGEYGGVTDVVESVVGRPPRTLRRLLDDEG